MLSLYCSCSLNHEQVKSNLERISKIKPFIDQCNWKEINFSPDKKDWKKFELIKSFLLIPHLCHTILKK